MRKLAVSFAVFFLFLLQAAQGWDSAGHQWLALRVCQDFNCGCPTDGGAVAPDRVFRDTARHHCYNTSVPCPSGSWTCPQKDDCPALAKTDEWIAKGANQTGCDRWYSLSVASHYFFDSKVFWHTVQKEDSGCHSGFETSAGKKFGKPGDWQVSKCGVTLYSSEVPGWISGFEAKLRAAGIEPEKPAYNPAIWAIPALIIAAIVAVFAKIRKRR